MKIIDLSHHNDISQIPKKLDGAMIRLLSGKNEDRKYMDFVNYFHTRRIPYGFYWYSYALNEEGLQKELDALASVFQKQNFVEPSLPLAFDFEDADGYKRSHGWDIYDPAKKELAISLCDMACRGVEAMGCYAMIYASDDVFQKVLNDDRLDRYDKWVARWGQKPPKTKWGMWQFTNRYLDQNIDCSITEMDYPRILSKMYARQK